MADLTLLIAQISASLTTIMGIVSLILMFTAARKLAKDSFRGFIMKSFFFFLLALIGVTAMTVYHFEESYGETEIWENLWFGFLFAAIVFSFYASWNIASFGKRFGSIKIKKVNPIRVKTEKAKSRTSSKHSRRK